MSGIFGVATLAQGALLILGESALKPYRAFGTIIPDVVISESGRDELEITRHPVERGAQITDHAFKRPLEVVIRTAWSDSGRYPNFVVDVYRALVMLQNSRRPFTLFTGKRSYPNMLIHSLTVETDASSEHALMVQASFREVIIVDTQATQVPASAQATPESTGSQANAGFKQLQPASSAQQSQLAANTAPYAESGVLPPSSIFKPTVLPPLGGA